MSGRNNHRAFPMISRDTARAVSARSSATEEQLTNSNVNHRKMTAAETSPVYFLRATDVVASRESAHDGSQKLGDESLPPASCIAATEQHPSGLDRVKPSLRKLASVASCSGRSGTTKTPIAFLIGGTAQA